MPFYFKFRHFDRHENSTVVILCPYKISELIGCYALQRIVIGSISKFKKTWIERCRHLCVCPLIEHRWEPIRMREFLGLLYNNFILHIDSLWRRNWGKLRNSKLSLIGTAFNDSYFWYFLICITECTLKLWVILIISLVQALIMTTETLSLKECHVRVILTVTIFLRRKVWQIIILNKLWLIPVHLGAPFDNDCWEAFSPRRSLCYKDH